MSRCEFIKLFSTVDPEDPKLFMAANVSQSTGVPLSFRFDASGIISVYLETDPLAREEVLAISDQIQST